MVCYNEHLLPFVCYYSFVFVMLVCDSLCWVVGWFVLVLVTLVFMICVVLRVGLVLFGLFAFYCVLY